jgi:xylose dehydrogenase (NAD/NADP)
MSYELVEMSERIGWGILGTGMIAKKFAGDLPGSDTGKLVATGSRGQESADKFAGKFGGTGYGSYEGVLGDEAVEAVYISLPNGLHKEWAIRCMEAGKHVLCEKPMACDVGEAEEMFAAAERTGKVLIEAFMYRAHPQMERILEMVRAEKVLGELRLIRSNFTFERPPSLSDGRYHVEHAGGSIMDVGCYCVNFARALVGSEPTDVACMAHRHEYGVDDYAAGVMRFGEDVLMTFTSGMTVKSDWRTFVAGTEASLEVNGFWFCEDPVYLVRKDGTREEVKVDAGKPLYAVEADAFAAAVAGGERFVEREETLGNMRVLDELRRKAGF